ncbi:MAG: methylated-DNA--[protein]-cysteine S-methyltransferase [Candidatus Saccharicenans sp.]|uniref:methylated-DNA--[protein]-cysteine S-methyltransferase n=1 Tax=Candidatus Saccharicenans sp. TaxID=2819258 RepID=UPI00404B34FB
MESCTFLRGKKNPDSNPAEARARLETAPTALHEAYQQLTEYFEGRRTEFSVKLNPSGTAFQKKVWARLRAIPFGQTRSYGQVARACGRPGAARAVGGANNRNPLVIFVPCHRVIGSDGSLTGFGGGLWRKKWLLEHERKVLVAGA